MKNIFHIYRGKGNIEQAKKQKKEKKRERKKNKTYGICIWSLLFKRKLFRLNTKTIS